MITPNLSGIDRMIRLSLGLFLLWLGLVAVDVIDDTALNLIVACFGAVNLLSAALSHCPLYKQAGISTLKPGSNPEVSQLRIQMVSIVSAMIMTVVVVFTMASWHITEETVLKSAIAIYGNAINQDLNNVVELARSHQDEKRIQQSFQAYDNNNRFVVVRNEHNRLIYHTRVNPVFRETYTQLLKLSENKFDNEKLIAGNLLASSHLLFNGRYRASVFQMITNNAIQSPFKSRYFIFIVLIGLWVSVWFGFKVSGLATRSLEKKNEEVIRQTLYDDLTGLPNRLLLLDRIQQAAKTGLRNNRSVALFIIDLDDFKDINNAVGHQNGDRLLILVGDRLSQTIRSTDTVAHLSGDSFAVLMPETGYDDARDCADKILTVFSTPFTIDLTARSIDVELKPSIGVSLFPDHGAEPDQLVRRAEIAMYRCKHSDIRISFFQPDDDPVSLQRLSLLAGLREAIEVDELELFYQPKLDATNQGIIGVEALARWHHKEMGFISPEMFIPLAEEAGLIRPLTCWVIDTAVKQCRAWIDEGMALSVAVNLSARNLHDPTLIDVIRSAINRYEIPAGLLQFEITESAMMHDPLAAQKNLTRIDKLGVGLAIDDFGTGYSSLSYLRSIPADELKIDKSFILGMSENRDNFVIVQSTIRMAHNLGKQLVAEGVEDQASLDSLIAMGCDIVQGYYFCRPLPADEFINWAYNYNKQIKNVVG